MSRDNTKLQLASKKPCYWNPMDVIILILCKKYVHSELIFPDFMLPEFAQGSSFSSRGRGRPKGVGFKNIRYSHPQRWVFSDIPDQSTKFINKCLKRAEIINGAKYDAKGAVFFAGFKIKLEDKNKWWCSEAVSFVLGFKKFHKTPLQLFLKIQLLNIIKHQTKGWKLKWY